MSLFDKRGFRFAETMAGTYAYVDSADDHHRFSFTVECKAASALRYLRNGKLVMKGTLEADGLASFVPIEGAMIMLPLTHRYIKYEFNFTGDDGMPYQFKGQKTIRWLDVQRSFSHLPGQIIDHSSAVVATCKTRFDLKADLFQFAASWKPA